MEIFQTGITAKLSQDDIDEAVIAWMAEQGYEVKAEEIEYTMGRNPKNLKAEIVTGQIAPSREAVAETRPSKSEPAEDTSEEEENLDVDPGEDEQSSAEDASDNEDEESDTASGGGSLFGND